MAAEKVAVEGVRQKRWQERWLWQRSLGRQIRKRGKKRRKERRGGGFRKGEEWRSVSERKGGKIEYGWNWRRKLGTEERRVAGKSPGHGAEKGDFQV